MPATKKKVTARPHVLVFGTCGARKWTSAREPIATGCKLGVDAKIWNDTMTCSACGGTATLIYPPPHSVRLTQDSIDRGRTAHRIRTCKLTAEVRALEVKVDAMYDSRTVQRYLVATQRLKEQRETLAHAMRMLGEYHLQEHPEDEDVPNG